ncbi:YqgQ family protein [Lactiplantibacillus sp. WILCCON 0030]|uniref:YqgQ family protein n=1 Tax=Lactiplantibacillus brownii TaxID=3069269 RepID=A0ABU1A9X8_9LACO|nr:YqgQ family protein [Lactiplantibacillus brownii]MDQ7937233.1 YqgQ family protein [Lactiplantibacillus brownii]
MKTLYDVQQLLKKFGVYVYVGKRIWDIELMAIEVDHLYQAGVLDAKMYARVKLVLTHEHRIEAEHARADHAHD